MVRDPVCGYDVEDFEYPEVEEYNGRLYYFTGIDCASKFREDPEKYVSGREDEYGIPVSGHAEHEES